MKILSVNKPFINDAILALIKDFGHGLVVTCTETIKNTNANIGCYDVLILSYNILTKEKFEFMVSNNLKTIVFLDEPIGVSGLDKLLANQVKGFLDLECRHDEIKRCLEYVLNDKTFIPEIINHRIVDSYSKIKTFRLTDRECEILDHLSNGLTLKEISNRLFLSENTVIAHKRNILRKTGLSKMTKLVSWWLQKIE